MNRALTVLAIGVAISVSHTMPVRAADVVALRLPAGTTIEPEGERPLISIGSDGTVAALASTTSSIAPHSLAVRWSSDGTQTTFDPPRPKLTGGMMLPPVVPSAVVAGRGAVYVTVEEHFTGAYMGVVRYVERWTAGRRSHDEVTSCPAGSNQDETVSGADASGRVAATFERTGVGSFTVQHETANAAPYAFIIDADGCHARGRAVMLGVRGAWASGYRGYLEHRIAPTNYHPEDQDDIAVRWHGTRLTELGEGVAYAVSAHGLAVGATAPAGPDAGTTPQAVVWDASGRRHLLEPTGLRSVAYDVADDGTIIGTLVGRDGKHYAFRRSQGRLELLDGFPHRPGWRFESAYAVTDDGTIVGVGTLDGVATVYRWRS